VRRGADQIHVTNSELSQLSIPCLADRVRDHCMEMRVKKPNDRKSRLLSGFLPSLNAAVTTNKAICSFLLILFALVLFAFIIALGNHYHSYLQKRDLKKMKATPYSNLIFYPLKDSGKLPEILFTGLISYCLHILIRNYDFSIGKEYIINIVSVFIYTHSPDRRLTSDFYVIGIPVFGHLCQSIKM